MIGDSLGMGFGGELAIATGYMSGDALSGSHTFAGQTFASLGITPGSYDYVLPSDTITLNFAATPVPLPASLLLLLGALGLGGVLGWRRKPRTAAA